MQRLQRRRQRAKLMPGMRDLPIRVKTALIVAPMAVAVIATGGWSLAGAVDQAGQAERSSSLVAVAGSAAELVAELQSERAALAALLLPDAGQQVAAAYGQQVERTRQSAQRWNAAVGQLQEPPATVAAVIQQVGEGLTDLDAQRARLAEGRPAALSNVMFGYRIVVAGLLAYEDAAAQIGVDPVLADEIRAVGSLARAKEATGQQQVTVLQAIALGQLTPSLAQDAAAARSLYEESLRRFGELGRPSWRVLLGRTMTGPDVLAGVRLEGVLTRTAAYGRVELAQAAWTRAMADRSARLREVELAVFGDISAAASAARDAQVTKALWQGSLTVLGLGVALLVGIVVARSTSYRLRRLEVGAVGIAAELPALVKQLGGVATAERAAAVGQEVLARRSDIASGRDEIGQVGAALDRLFTAAVTSAVAEAGSRIALGEAMVVVARRARGLVAGIIASLDGLEAEATPDELEKLFPLDHRVTQLRRYHDNLLVLGLAGLDALHSQDEEIYQVVNAAAGEVEQYTRVHLRHCEPGMVIARAVPAVVTILRELVDNATRYSGTDTQVVVDAAWSEQGLCFQVHDRGIGMSAEVVQAYNAVLSGQRAPGRVSGQLGLTVTAILADQYGIGVRLDSSSGSTVAQVLVPGSLTVRVVHRPAALPAQDARADRAGWNTTTAVLAAPAGQPARPGAWAGSAWLDPAAGPAFATGADHAWQAAQRLDQVEAEHTRAGLPRRAAGRSGVPEPLPTGRPAASSIDPATFSAQITSTLRGLRAAQSPNPTGDQR